MPTAIAIGISPAFGTGGGGGALPKLAVSSTIKDDGDSFDAQNYFAHEMLWTNFFLNGRLRFLTGWQNGAAGERTDQVYDGRATALSPAPDIMAVLDGTNDVVQSVAASTIVNGPKGDAAYITAALAAGVKRVFYRAIPAAPDASEIGTGSKETIRVSTNSLRSGLAAPAVIYSDIGSLITNDNQLADHLHFLPRTALAAARDYHAPAIDAHLVAGDALGTVAPAGDLSGVWALPGTGGSKFGSAGVTGSVATGCFVSDNNNTGLLTACSKSTLNGFTAQRLVLSGTPANTDSLSFVRQFARTTTPGEIYDAMVDCQFGPNPTGILGFGLYLIKYDGGQEVCRWGNSNVDFADATLWGNNTIKGVMRGVPAAIISSSNGSGLGFEIRIGVKSGVTVSLDAYFGRMQTLLV